MKGGLIMSEKAEQIRKQFTTDHSAQAIDAQDEAGLPYITAHILLEIAAQLADINEQLRAGIVSVDATVDVLE
jgi:hypothetical protein